jgi:hypothetical protein
MSEMAGVLNIPERALGVAGRVAEGAFRAIGNTMPGQLVLGSGSSSSAYAELKWSKSPLDPADINWCEIADDPEAGWGGLPRHWENAAIIGADRDSFIEPCADDLRNGNRRVQDAVVCLSEGVVRIGTRPDTDKSDNLFGAKAAKTAEDKTQTAIAICRSQHLLKATIALVREGEVYLPNRATVLESLPINKVLYHRYPGISLVQIPPA